MGRSIIKLSKDDRDFYMEYSSVVDAPVTYGMNLDQFTKYYASRYGTAAMEFEFPDRMGRVEEKGTSSFMYASVREEISFNRAGPNESCITMDQFIELYCLNNTDEV